DPFRSGAPDQRRYCIDDQPKTILGFLDFVKCPLQFLLGFVLLGDIHMRTDDFDHVTVAVYDRMSDGMYALCRAVRKRYAKVNFEVRLVANGPRHQFNNPPPVLRENTLLKGLG